MNEYSIHYIDELGTVQSVKVEHIGLAEAVDDFIDTFCPVQCITAVQLVAKPKVFNRESKPA
jgi:hypothetical protein